jgi:hypothetical protein
MIVVGALQPDESDPLWPMSAFSPFRVHIAAPGANIRSIGAENQNICNNGTSAATPLVSFTAGMIRALTGAPRRGDLDRNQAGTDSDGNGVRLRVNMNANLD